MICCTTYRWTPGTVVFATIAVGWMVVGDAPSIVLGSNSAIAQERTRPNPAERAPSRRPTSPLDAPLPDSPAERAKLLSNLHAYLATAETAADAEPIAAAIERLWLLSGSDTVGYLMERAARALAEKNTALAMRFLDQVVDLAPDFAEGWNRRAYTHFLSGDIERALGDLRRCIALQPTHYRALEALATIFRERGQHAAALKIYETLLEIHPNLPGVQDAIKDLSRKVEGQRT